MVQTLPRPGVLDAPGELIHPIGTIRAVVLDAVGTTVTLEGAFETAVVEALDAAGVDVGPATSPARRLTLHALAASPTPAMFALYLGDEGLGRLAQHVFDAAFATAVERGDIEAVPGADETLVRLRSAGIRVGLSTALDDPLADLLVEALGWRDLLDAVLAADPSLRRRPYPDEILAAMVALEVDAVQQVAVVGDSIGDLVAGTRAGASVVAGVLGGAHGREDLAAAPHTHLLERLDALPEIVLA